MKIYIIIASCLILSGCITSDPSKPAITGSVSTFETPNHKTITNNYDMKCGLLNTNKTITLNNYYTINCIKENATHWKASNYEFNEYHIDYTTSDDGIYRAIVMCRMANNSILDRDFNDALCNTEDESPND